jgi:hypothetical protein
MLSTLTAPDLTLLFLGIVVCLSAATVTAIWQIEQAPLRQQSGNPRLRR